MKKSLIAWTCLLIVTLACSLFQPEQKEIPPLQFPDYAPTYTPIPPEFIESGTPVPELVTATPITPSPTSATVNLERLGQWHQENAYDIFWYPDTQHFGIVGPQELRVYQTSTLTKLWLAETEGAESRFQAVSVSSNGNFVINFNQGPAVYILDADSGEITDKKRVLTECSATTPLQSVYLSDGTKHLFVAAQDPNALDAPVKLYKWGLSPYSCHVIGTASTGTLDNLLLSPDEKYVVVSTNKGLVGEVTAWDVATGKPVCTIQGAAASFRPSDGWLAVANMENNTLDYWSLGACLANKQIPWTGYSARQSLAFTPNGKYLFTFRQGIQVWDANTAALLLERIPQGSVEGGLLRISPDGMYLLSITNPNSPNALVELWAIHD